MQEMKKSMIKLLDMDRMIEQYTHTKMKKSSNKKDKQEISKLQNDQIRNTYCCLSQNQFKQNDKIGLNLNRYNRRLKYENNQQLSNYVQKNIIKQNKQRISKQQKPIITQRCSQTKLKQIDLQNPTLSKIKQKLKLFQSKNNTQTKLSLYQNVKQSHKQFEKYQKKSTLATLDMQIQTIITDVNQNTIINNDTKFMGIDVDYYGFSFRNKIPIKNCSKQRYLQNKPQQNMSLSSIKISKQQRNIQNNIQRRKTYGTLQSNKKIPANESKLNNRAISKSTCTLKPKQLLKERYQILKLIGRGMSGEVFQAKDVLANRQVAIKVTSVDTLEYQFFRQVSHQNIIQYYNSFTEKSKRYLVLEYIPFTLSTLLKQKNYLNRQSSEDQVPQQSLKHIFKSIVNGLSYLHSMSISHRDIKLDNILISHDLQTIKFIDFGLCIDTSKIEKGLSKDFCGTLSYLSPQILEGKYYQPKKADIWSLGIVLYCLSLGRLPFKARNQIQMLSRINRTKLIFPKDFNCDLKNLLQKMLQKDPNKRLNINQIMCHKWNH